MKQQAKPPVKCDRCRMDIGNHFPDETPTCYDAKTIHGSWAWLCPECFDEIGVGLGTGRGQKYEYSIEDMKWYKVEG